MKMAVKEAPNQTQEQTHLISASLDFLVQMRGSAIIKRMKTRINENENEKGDKDENTTGEGERYKQVAMAMLLSAVF